MKPAQARRQGSVQRDLGEPVDLVEIGRAREQDQLVTARLGELASGVPDGIRVGQGCLGGLIRVRAGEGVVVGQVSPCGVRTVRAQRVVAEGDQPRSTLPAGVGPRGPDPEAYS